MAAYIAAGRGPAAKKQLYSQNLQPKWKLRQLFGSPGNADLALDLTNLKAVKNTIVQNNVWNNSDGVRASKGSTIPKRLKNSFFTRPATMTTCTTILGSETTKAIKEIDLC